MPHCGDERPPMEGRGGWVLFWHLAPMGPCLHGDSTSSRKMEKDEGGFSPLFFSSFQEQLFFPYFFFADPIWRKRFSAFLPQSQSVFSVFVRVVSFFLSSSSFSLFLQVSSSHSPCRFLQIVPPSSSSSSLAGISHALRMGTGKERKKKGGLALSLLRWHSQLYFFFLSLSPTNELCGALGKWKRGKRHIKIQIEKSHLAIHLGAKRSSQPTKSPFSFVDDR